MTNSWIGLRKPGLLATVAPLSMLLGAPALAQSVPDANQNAETNAQVAQGAEQADAGTGGDIVVTGSIIRGADVGPSPVSTITAENLDVRGIGSMRKLGVMPPSVRPSTSESHWPTCHQGYGRGVAQADAPLWASTASVASLRSALRRPG